LNKKITPNFRLAMVKDIPRLAKIEETCFESDRLSRRSFHRLIKNGHAKFLCLIVDKTIAGYGLLFFRRGTSLARLYSLAIDPQYQGQGLSRLLMDELEKKAIEASKSSIRLEVRADNQSAIQLYEKLGYKRFKVKLDYYEDHTKALCYEKRLLRPQKLFKIKVPYYSQTTDFTCGPSSLMMAMTALEPKRVMSQSLELDLWREATTIFMLSGHGGCGPRGLALAAWRRGFAVDVHISRRDELFLDSVRTEKKKNIIKLVHRDFTEKLKTAKIAVSHTPVTLKQIKDKMKAGIVPIILISSYQITHTKTPHWVVISGLDEHYVYLHDPDVLDDGKDHEESGLSTDYDGVYIPVPHQKFLEMARWGTKKLEAVVFISRKKPKVSKTRKTFKKSVKVQIKKGIKAGMKKKTKN